MSSHDNTPSGPDLAAGVPIESIPATGVLAGHVDGAPVLLVRYDEGFVALSGSCTHYGAPLADGLIENGVVRCPWHHACFSLRTGEALSAPAFAGLATYRIEVVAGTLFVRERIEAPTAPASLTAAGSPPQRVVIIGGGAAGFAAAERLRHLGYAGSLTMLSEDTSAPCDRPNLSKAYLAGTAQADWLSLQSPEFYAEQRIDLRLDCAVTRLDTAAREVVTRSGERFGYDRLLLATGAEPVRLSTPGFELPNVCSLRSVSDTNAIIDAVGSAKSVTMIGAGFIGLEAAAALRTRGLDVHVVAREQIPLARVLGNDIGTLLTDLHRQHGVVFHLQRDATRYDGRTLTLDDGTTIDADLLIVGVGVKPRTQLATDAGFAVGNGVIVDSRLQTSQADVFAIGDIACYPLRGESVRIEHWVHAQRQGQAAAANMLGARQEFADVPFFWTSHYDLNVRYVGHASRWDEVRIDGSPSERDCTARFYCDGRLLAAASIGRDLENLKIESELRASM